jgi:hypothetical protein
MNAGEIRAGPPDLALFAALAGGSTQGGRAMSNLCITGMPSPLTASADTAFDHEEPAIRLCAGQGRSGWLAGVFYVGFDIFIIALSCQEQF